MERSVNTPDGPRAVRVPEGIDPGWAYNVGQAAQAGRLAQQAARDIGKMPADLGAVVGESIAAATRRALAEDYRAWVAERASDGWQQDGSWRALGALSPQTVALLVAAGQPPATAGVAITAEKLRRLVRDTKVADGVALDLADIQRLPEIVDAPDAVLRDRRDGVLLLVFTPAAGERRGKLVVQIDFKRQLRDPDGSRVRRVFNAVKSGGVVPVEQLRDPNFYELIEGDL